MVKMHRDAAEGRTPEFGNVSETGMPESGNMPETGTPGAVVVPETGTPGAVVAPETGKGKAAAIVLAGGRGKRMGTDVPKQYALLCGRPLITYSLKVFEESFIDRIVLVCTAGDEEYCRKEIVERYGYRKVTDIVPGGRERYHSVATGIVALPEDTDYVFIHDGARPFVSAVILERAFDCVREHGACVVGMPVKDTVKIVDAQGIVRETPKRDLVWQIQTPQVFRYPLIRKAMEELLKREDELLADGVVITDDAMAVERMTGQTVRVTEGSYTNIKVTTPEDMITAENFIRSGSCF